MKRSRRLIEPEKLDELYASYLKTIKKGEANLEHFYCVFEFEDGEYSMPHMLTIFDFVDQYAAGAISKDKISYFYTYQPYYQK